MDIPLSSGDQAETEESSVPRKAGLDIPLSPGVPLSPGDQAETEESSLDGDPGRREEPEDSSQVARRAPPGFYPQFKVTIRRRNNIKQRRIDRTYGGVFPQDIEPGDISSADVDLGNFDEDDIDEESGSIQEDQRKGIFKSCGFVFPLLDIWVYCDKYLFVFILYDCFRRQIATCTNPNG